MTLPSLIRTKRYRIENWPRASSSVLPGRSSSANAEARPVRSDPHAQWIRSGCSDFSSVSTSVRSWARDIHKHDDMAMSMWVAPSSRVVESSSRYQDSEGLDPLRLRTVLIRRSRMVCARADAGICPDR